MKKFRMTTLGLVAAMLASCTTSYDSYGRRTQSIDPGAAAVGAVALGAIAYSVGKDRGKRKARRYTNYNHYDYGHRGYDRYRGGYSGYGGYYR